MQFDRKQLTRYAIKKFGIKSSHSYTIVMWHANTYLPLVSGLAARTSCRVSGLRPSLSEANTLLFCDLTERSHPCRQCGTRQPFQTSLIKR